MEDVRKNITGILNGEQYEDLFALGQFNSENARFILEVWMFYFNHIFLFLAADEANSSLQ